jgi:hypothetical protein
MAFYEKKFYEMSFYEMVKKNSMKWPDPILINSFFWRRMIWNGVECCELMGIYGFWHFLKWVTLIFLCQKGKIEAFFTIFNKIRANQNDSCQKVSKSKLQPIYIIWLVFRDFPWFGTN